MPASDPILKLIEAFSKLPGIGERSAERLAFHVLAQPRDEALQLATAIQEVKDHVHACTTCFNISEKNPCALCSDARRDRTLLCIVEQPKDLWTIEKTGSFRGLYHVLQGRLSPLDGIGPEDLTIRPLVERVKAGGIREVILATNPTAEGDATSFYLQRALAEMGVRITRLARGLPAGGSLEHANRTILLDAIQGRREL